MIRHKIFAQHFGTDKNYDEILCDNDFNENLREVLKECLKEHLPQCMSWGCTLFFHPAYSHCGCMTMSGYCCSFQEYKKTYYEETALLGGEARSLIVTGMVYAIFSVQKNRVQGTSDFLDSLELFLDKYNFFHHFKQLVKQTKSRYNFNFSIKSNLSDNLCRWDLEDFSDALQVSIVGTFLERPFYKFLNLPWRDKEDQLVALERIKEYYEKKYRGESHEIFYGDMRKNVSLDDSFYPLYEEAKRKIEKELDIAFKAKRGKESKVVKEELQNASIEKPISNEIPPSVKECFRFTSNFVKEHVQAIVKDFYLNSPANLAIIERTLFDHNALKSFNSHTPFIRALMDWGILPKDTDIRKTANGMATKFKNLPKDGYKKWSNDYLNDRTMCIDIAGKLDKTMKYRHDE